MFVQVHNAPIKIRPNGDVWNNDLQDVPPRQNAVGELVVDAGGKTYKVKDLVVAHHGEPPHQLRFPADDEETVCQDGNELNVHISNLKIEKKEKDNKTFEDLSDDELKIIAEMIASDTKYKDIIDHYEKKGVKLVKPQITKIKKRFLKK